MTDAQQILNAALELPADDRATIARKLLLSLDSQEFDADWEEAWDREIEARLAKIERGEAILVDRDEAMARIRQATQARPQ